MSEFNSEYDIQKEILGKIGGDNTERFDSPYDIQLAILEAVEQGGGGGGGLKPVVVDELPETGEEGKIYFVPNAEAGEKDNYKEYIWANGAWELIGNANVDLTDYLTKEEAEETYSLKPYKTLKFRIGEPATVYSTRSITIDEYKEIEAAILAGRPILVNYEYENADHLIDSGKYYDTKAVAASTEIHLNVISRGGRSAGGTTSIEPYQAKITIKNTGVVTVGYYYTLASKDYVDTKIGDINAALEAIIGA